MAKVSPTRQQPAPTTSGAHAPPVDDACPTRSGGGSPRRSGRRRSLLVTTLIALGGVGFGALPATASAGCRGADRTVASQGSAKAEKAVRCLVNQQRRSAGLRKLSYSGRAARAAQRHTNDMVHRHYFSHVSPGGSTIATRASAAGIRWRKVGENIAVGQRTPASVVAAWMSSPDHRANIMNPAFTRLGVGASRKGAAGYSGPTWTQVFSKPKG